MTGFLDALPERYRVIFATWGCHAVSRAAISDRTAILAVGDSIATEFVGAANAGIDFVFVAGGIDAAAYRADAEQSFACAVGLRSDWMRPVGIGPGFGCRTRMSVWRRRSREAC